MNRALKELCKILGGHPDIVLTPEEPMSKHTTFRIGGPAELFCELKTPQVVVHAMRAAARLEIRPFILGNGSNLLVSDEGVPGAVFKITGGECHRSGIFVSMDAGVSLAAAARFALRQGLSGFEFAYGIPGTVGGAVVMNAGAYGFEMQDFIIETSYLTPTGEVTRAGRRELEFGYRTSFFKKHPGCVMLTAKIGLREGDPEKIRQKMEETMAARREKQPLELPSAGSIFKRPAGHYAGALIEQCGLKGYRIGGAEVSPKHAGFIVNTGGATCADVLYLIEHIRNTVLKECGVTLECEVLCAPRRV